VVVVVVCIGCGVVQRALQEGVDIVVATPAKAKDLMEQGCGPTPSLLSLLLPLSPHCVCVCVSYWDRFLDLSMVHFFVLDEADSLVDKDTLPTVLALYNACPSFGKGEHRLQVQRHMPYTCSLSHSY
jgi:superfamily II DNA/RNA helicase